LKIAWSTSYSLSLNIFRIFGITGINPALCTPQTVTITRHSITTLTLDPADTLQLPEHQTRLLDSNFFVRMLYTNTLPAHRKILRFLSMLLFLLRRVS